MNKYIDHTCLKQGATIEDITKLCNEALEYNFAAVCIPPCYVELAKNLLKNSDVKVCTVVGFPFGYSTTNIKYVEFEEAMLDGADEIDIVQNVSFVKNGDWNSLESEIETLIDAYLINGGTIDMSQYKNGKTLNGKNVIIKVILETGILTDVEIAKCCILYSKYPEVKFVKTSTGYAEKGASVHAVEIMKKNIREDMQIKASGGIRDYKFAKELIDAGATRLGCSASINIMKGIDDCETVDKY